LGDALKRFATGTYMVWYPVLLRPESRNFAAALTRVAQSARAKWLHATLNVATLNADAKGLVASALFIINPPYPLLAALQESLPVLTRLLGTGAGAAYSLTYSDL
jgi:23S rRNA (adenine2030-N6)-methyltransferase